MDLKKSIAQSIDAKKDDYIRFLQKIIQQPTTSGNELVAQGLIADRLKALGLEVDIWTPDYNELMKSEFFNPLRDNYDNSPNVVGILKGSDSEKGRSVILNGHIDVVPAGDEEKWTHDPFSGKVIDGKIYGRGTTDMKGGNLSTLIALETIINLGLTLKG